jgi:uncharacterized protein
VTCSLIALLAGRAGGLLQPTVLASLSRIPRTTLMRYLELLVSVFLIKSIPAWSSGQTRRAVGTPKLAFVDTGIASHLIGQDSVRLGEPCGAAGAMMENFVVMELARQAHLVRGAWTAVSLPDQGQAGSRRGHRDT